MTAHRLFLTPAARGDITDIYEYGCGHWGELRASTYRADITQALWRLKWSPGIGKCRDEYAAGLRSLRVHEHLVYYRIMHGTVEILRILHSRQDPESELS